jgi:hypothetical protein
MPERLQTNFSNGELSPELYSRADYDGFYKAVKKAENVLINPRGGLIRRFGTRFLYRNNYADVASELAIYVFRVGLYSYYCLQVDPSFINIFYEGNLVAQIAHPYARQQIQDLRFVQIGTSPLILHEKYVPRYLNRGDSAAYPITGLGVEDDSLAISGPALAVGLVLPFKLTTSGTLPSSSPAVDEDTVYFARVVANGEIRLFETPTNASADSSPISLINAGTSSNVVFQNEWSLAEFEFKTQPTWDYAQDYFTATFDFDHTTNTLTCSEAIFTTNHVGGLFKFPFYLDIDALVARIATFVDANNVTVYGTWTTSPTGINGADCFLLEVAFSDERGWPKTGELFQNRLMFGGNTSQPGVIWASVTNNESDFDDSSAEDANGFSLASNKNAGFIISMEASKTFTVFTTSGVYSTVISTSAAITPNNRKFDQESDDGCLAIPAVQLDNKIYYASAGGRSITSIGFDIKQNSYNFMNASILSNHLIDTPVSSCAVKSSFDKDSSYAMFTMTDGTIAILSALEEQGVAGWTQITTDGYFRQLASQDGYIFAVVEREIQGNMEFFLEQIDFNYLVDSGKKYVYESPSSTVTGLDHLNDETVKVIADGYRYERTVSGGSIDLESAATEVEVGLGFTPEIQPLNFTVPDYGTYLYRPKRVQIIYVDYYNSYNVLVNGDEIPMDQFGDSFINSAPTVQTGVYKWAPMTGPQRELDVTITQEDPWPFTLRGLGYEVSND